jgi:hypothetical protein
MRQVPLPALAISRATASPTSSKEMAEEFVDEIVFMPRTGEARFAIKKIASCARIHWAIGINLI